MQLFIQLAGALYKYHCVNMPEIEMNAGVCLVCLTAESWVVIKLRVPTELCKCSVQMETNYRNTGLMLSRSQSNFLKAE